MPDNSTEPTSQQTQARVGASISLKPGVAYTNILRTLTEKDLKHVAVVRMIINERDNLQADNTELKGIRNKYYDVVTQNAVLKGAIKTSTAFEVISIGMVSVGSAISGFSISPLNLVFFILGILLIAVGIFAKTIKIK